MIDILMASWVAAAGISFAALPLIGLTASSDACGPWIAGVWDAWRFPYGIALAICAAVTAVRAYRQLMAARRHGG